MFLSLPLTDLYSSARFRGFANGFSGGLEGFLKSFKNCAKDGFKLCSEASQSGKITFRPEKPKLRTADNQTCEDFFECPGIAWALFFSALPAACLRGWGYRHSQGDLWRG